jgi:hypothetical protein
MRHVDAVTVRLPRVAALPSLALLIATACSSKPSGPPPLGAVALTCRLAIDKGPKVPCEMEVRDHAARVLYADHAGVDVLDGSSSAFVKPSYGVELRDVAGSSLSMNFFDMGGDGDWVLDGFEGDRSMMRTALVYDSFRAIGASRYAPEGHYVTLTLNDAPQGIYRLVEKIKRDDDRVAIGTDDGTGRTFIVKVATGTDPVFPEALGVAWEFVYPSETAATPAQRSAVTSWLLTLQGAISDGNASNLFNHVDRDTLVDWVLLQELGKNLDAYTHDIHLVRDGGGRARFVPWDFDLTFGQPTLDITPGNEAPEGWISDRPAFIDDLAAIPEVKSRLAERWRALRGGPWSNAAFARRLDGYAVTLDPTAVATNFDIWDAAAHDTGIEDAAGLDGAPTSDADANDDAAVAAASDAGEADAGNPDAGPPKPVYGYYPVADHADEVAKLRAFIDARLAWIDAHIDGYPN